MVYQQHDDHHDLHTAKTTAKKNNKENGYAQVHKPDVTEVAEEMDGHTAADKDDMSATGAAVTALSDDLRLEVTCGQNQAVLYTSRLQLGSKGTCVLFENAWLTPNEFQYVSGRETAKDWKRSIKHHGKSLKVLIAKGILSTTPPARCNCSQCITSPKKDADTWRLSSDRTVVLSSSVMVTKTSGVSNTWQVPHTKHNNGLAKDSSAFRPPADVGGLPDTTSITSLYSSHSKIAAIATDVEDSMSSSDRCLIKKCQKRSMSPSGIDVTAEAQSKFLRTSASQRLYGSTSSLTAADVFPRDESVCNNSKQQFSPLDNRRQIEEFPSQACALIPLCHEYQSSADGSRNFQLLPQEDVVGMRNLPTISTVSSIATANRTSQPCVVSPVAASPYLPFFTSTPSSNISSLYYPNPYIMLSAPPLACQQTPPHFPCGWISSAVGAGPTPSNSKLVAEHMQQLDSQTHQQLHRAPPISAAFDFPWMRGNPMQTTHEHNLVAVTKQSFGFNQHIFMHNVSSLGSALISDGLDMYRQPPCELPSIANRMLLDNQHTSSYLGIYPPLFHTPYLGIPSR